MNESKAFIDGKNFHYLLALSYLVLFAFFVVKTLGRFAAGRGRSTSLIARCSIV